MSNEKKSQRRLNSRLSKKLGELKILQNLREQTEVLIRKLADAK